MEQPISIETFYNDINVTLPHDVKEDIGHFNVFEIPKVMAKYKEQAVMPYNRRSYYKISLICGKNKAEYADRTFTIENNALLFATPKIPYHYYPLDENQEGYFCVFTEDFLVKNQSQLALNTLPIFQPDGYPIFELTDAQVNEFSYIFEKMQKEINSDYAYKYDLLRMYVLELIHQGQKLQPVNATYSEVNATSRITSLFIELLERQFPIEAPQQRLELKTAKEYADRLSIHVNHLNKVLKESTGKTTTNIINNRILKEAKILLHQTDWNISDISFGLGFEELSHFSNFFKKQTSLTPLKYRSTSN